MSFLTAFTLATLTVSNSAFLQPTETAPPTQNAQNPAQPSTATQPASPAPADANAKMQFDPFDAQQQANANASATQPAAAQPASTQPATTAAPVQSPTAPTAQPAQPASTAPAPATEPPPAIVAGEPPPARTQNRAVPSQKAPEAALTRRQQRKKQRKSPRRGRRDWPVLPINYRLEAFLGGGSTVITHPSYDYFSGQNRRTNLDLWARADFRRSKHVFIGAELGYGAKETSGGAFGYSLRSSVQTRDIKLAFRGAYVPFDGLDIYLHLGGGPTIANLDFDSSLYAEQNKVTWFAQGMAGAMLYLPKKWLPRRGSSRVTPGLDLAGGYRYTGAINTEPEIFIEEENIPVQTNPFGKLQLRGAQIRIGAFIRFM